MVTRIIENIEELDDFSSEKISKIHKAVAAVALTLRDDARKDFKSSGNKYKHHTPNFDKLADGIVVKKNTDSEYVLTAISKVTPYAYKTRFFAGGTVFRYDRNGAFRGRIESLHTIDNASIEGQLLLNQYIKSAIEG